MTEESIFVAALDRPTPAERSAFLDAACGNDAALRQRVVALIEAHEHAADFLERPAVEQMAANSPSDSRTSAAHAIRPAGARSEETQAESPPVAEDGLSLDFLTPSERSDALGLLGHYHVLAVIGRGGMGVVLKAFDEELQRVVAIKVMSSQMAVTSMARKRFRREAQAAAAVRDEHIIDIHAVEEVNGLPYLVMEYVSGISLQERIDQSGPLELKEILRIGMQTATGLAKAHAQGLIHRDIKPANILLENGVQRVKITDFGLARAVDDASLTQSGLIAGTPQYMAPEQARGEAVDHRADLFSLGSVLYAMCTGHSPFRANSTMAVLKRVCDDTPRSIREVNPEIPDWLCAIIDKLLAKDPAHRFQSASEVAELLGQHLAHLQHPALVPMPPCVARPYASTAIVARKSALRGPVLLMLTPFILIPVILVVSLLFGFTWRSFDVYAVVSGSVALTGLILLIVRLAARHGQERAALPPSVRRPTLPRPSTSSHVWPWVLAAVCLMFLLCCVVSVPALVMLGLLVGYAEAPPQPVAESAESLEPEVIPPPALPPEPAKAPNPQAAVKPAGIRPIVILPRGGKAERPFATLEEAVAAAGNGDTIEVRGNGPIASGPILLANKALTIRAGEGFRPILDLQPRDGKMEDPLLETYVPLVLEGLTLQCLAPWPKEGKHPERKALILASKAPLHAANCRFLTQKPGVAIWALESSVCDLRNCQFGGSNLHAAVDWTSPPGGSLTLENCLLLAGPHGLVIHHPKWAGARGGSVRLTHNTLSADVLLEYWLWAPIQQVLAAAKDQNAQPFRIEAKANLFDAQLCILNFKQVDQSRPLPAKEAETALPRLVSWRERQNIYPAKPRPFLQLSSEGSGDVLHPPVFPAGLATTAEWGRYWGLEKTDAVHGVLRYQGGEVRARAKSNFEQIRASDLRLRMGSAGKSAGEDGRDLGADVDLVGPGAAYERWKKTPAYRQWLKDIRPAEDGKP